MALFGHFRAHAAAAAAVGISALTLVGAPSAAGTEQRKNFATRPIECIDGTSVMPWSCPSREVQLEKLQAGTTYDVLVVGGGCVGAGVALEAASRGLKVAAVDQSDWASGTSGRSTKLIHGGIRYLEKAFMSLDIKQYELVKEALAERAHLLNAAPYMAHAMPIMIPIYKWWELPYMWAGAKAYDFIAGSKRILPASRFLSKEEALYSFPNLNDEGLQGAVVYYDGMHNDTRMNLMIALTAAQKGATIANYTKVASLRKDAKGRLCGARLRDELSGMEWDVKCRAVINATGPFADALRLMDDENASTAIVPAAGTHLVLGDHFCPDKMGLIVPKTRDGRVLFFLPWEGHALVGTTDSPSEITMTPAATEEDVAFILEESNRFLSTTIARSDVKSAWSGLRPLVKSSEQRAQERQAISAAREASGSKEEGDAAAQAIREGGVSGGGKSTANFVRSHEVEVSPSGLVSVLGGKWTTYRAMAQDTVDALVEHAPSFPLIASKVQPSRTLNGQLLGADRAGIVVKQKFDRITVTLRETYGLDKDVAKHLVHNYGTRALQVAQIAVSRPGGELMQRLVRKHPYLRAEVVFAVQQEMACRAVDFIARRSRLAFTDTESSLASTEAVVALMGDELEWSAVRRAEEKEAVLAFMKTMSATGTVQES